MSTTHLSDSVSVKPVALGALLKIAGKMTPEDVHGKADETAKLLASFGAADTDIVIAYDSDGGLTPLRLWLEISVETLDRLGPNFCRQVALAVFAGQLSITETRNGVGFRAL